MKFGKRLICLLLSIAMIVYVGCTDVNSDSGAITIIWPSYLINMMGYTAEQQVELIAESNEEKQYANSIYANEDGSITFEMNEKQLDNNRKKFMDHIEKSIETAKKNKIELKVSDDYKELTFTFSKTVVIGDFISLYSLTASSIIALRMFQGEDPEDWHLVVRVIDADTGRQIKEGTLPDEEWSLKPEDWEE